MILAKTLVLMPALWMNLQAATTSYSTQGQCVPYDQNPGYGAFCSALPKEACEARRYICVWIPAPKEDIEIR